MSISLTQADREELKEVMRELFEEILWELEQQQPDPDEGLSFKPEVAAYLAAALKQKDRRGKPHDQLMRELGIDA